MLLSLSVLGNILPGAEQPEQYLPLLKDQRVGLIVNPSSRVQKTHLIDYLLQKQIQVKRLFALEHGLRGESDAGSSIDDGFDDLTGLPIISLYGKKKAPSSKDLENIDWLIFDIQDVGVRFYTYISSLHHIMESAAKNDKKLLILDRPNPNGDYIDGPVLRLKFQSFVGMHPIPLVHGLTVGELAQMINGQGWLEKGIKAFIQIIPVKNYSHQMPYSLPVKPSPNLPNDLSIRLYPSLALFEPTQVSIGRGTYFPFQVIGFPQKKLGDFTFTPKSIPGMSTNPKHLGKLCYGQDLRSLLPSAGFHLQWIINAYQDLSLGESFFSSPRFFNLLVGNDQLIEQIKAKVPENVIRKSWEKELQTYKKMRLSYLLYP